MKKLILILAIMIPVLGSGQGMLVMNTTATSAETQKSGDNISANNTPASGSSQSATQATAKKVNVASVIVLSNDGTWKHYPVQSEADLANLAKLLSAPVISSEISTAINIAGKTAEDDNQGVNTNVSELGITTPNEAFELPAIVMDSFTDTRDGKSYPTVKIGGLTWFAKNLAYKTTKGCWAFNNIEDNAEEYGYYYSWETAKSVCPEWWRLSNDDDWQKLNLALDGESVAGGKLKSVSGWETPNIEATNSTRFSAIGSGARDEDGSFSYLGEFGYWWSASEFNTSVAWARRIGNTSSSVYKFFSWKVNGFSVRCVKE